MSGTRALLTLAIACLATPTLGRPNEVDSGLSHLQSNSEGLSPRRSLLATYTESKCLWDGPGSTCRLNPDFVTTLGTPTTDSAKLVARAQAQLGACALQKGNETGCKAYKYCLYDIATLGCSVNNSYINPTWLRNTSICQGSWADQGLGCMTTTSQDACNTNAACVYNATTIDGTARTFLGFVATWLGLRSDGLCKPKWATNSTLINNALAAASSGGTSTFTSLLGIFTGNCSVSNAFLSMFGGCTLYTSPATCLSMPGCTWNSASCGLSAGFLVDLLASPTDSFVSSVRTAMVACGRKTDSSDCTAVGNITADTDVQASFITLQSVYTLDSGSGSGTGTGGNGGGGAAGRAFVSPVLLGLLAGLVSLMAVLL